MLFDPAVIFSGACYTGVVGRLYYPQNGGYKTLFVQPQFSFALGILAANTLAYFAPLHSANGLPVYQEIEYLLYQQAAFGDVIKSTIDGVVVASSGRPFYQECSFPHFPPSEPASENMLHSSASRVLFGDPAMRFEGLSAPSAWKVCQLKPESGQETVLKIIVKITNDQLKATFADTYHADLSLTGQYNGRLLISFSLPQKNYQQIALKSVFF